MAVRRRGITSQVASGTLIAIAGVTASSVVLVTMLTHTTTATGVAFVAPPEAGGIRPAFAGGGNASYSYFVASF